MLIKGILLLIAASLVLVTGLRWIDPPTSAFMLQARFAERAAGGETQPIRYRWVDFKEISPQLALAFVAAEDQKFPHHRGFDFAAIQDALTHNRENRRLRGASTITQQVAKNLFLWSGRNYLRKGLEAYFTFLLESIWPKRRILEVYLNIAQLGDRLFGVGAASRVYLNQPASQVGRTQAALFAAVLPNPRRYQVLAPSAYVQERQRWVLRQMSALGGPAYLDSICLPKPVVVRRAMDPFGESHPVSLLTYVYTARQPFELTWRSGGPGRL